MLRLFKRPQWFYIWIGFNLYYKALNFNESVYLIQSSGVVASSDTSLLPHFFKNVFFLFSIYLKTVAQNL